MSLLDILFLPGLVRKDGRGGGEEEGMMGVSLSSRFGVGGAEDTMVGRPRAELAALDRGLLDD